MSSQPAEVRRPHRALPMAALAVAICVLAVVAIWSRGDKRIRLRQNHSAKVVASPTAVCRDMVNGSILYASDYDLFALDAFGVSRRIERFPERVWAIAKHGQDEALVLSGPMLYRLDKWGSATELGKTQEPHSNFLASRGDRILVGSKFYAGSLLVLDDSGARLLELTARQASAADIDLDSGDVLVGGYHGDLFYHRQSDESLTELSAKMDSVQHVAALGSRLLAFDLRGRIVAAGASGSNGDIVIERYDLLDRYTHDFVQLSDRYTVCLGGDDRIVVADWREMERHFFDRKFGCVIDHMVRVDERAFAHYAWPVGAFLFYEIVE